MLRLKNKIKDVICGLGNYRIIFNYASANQQNVNLIDQVLLDGSFAIVLLEIEEGQFQINQNRGDFKEAYPAIQMQFMSKSGFDYNSDQNDEVIDRCKELAKYFLLSLDEKAYFAPITNTTFRQLYRAYDDNLSGVELTLNLIENNSQSTCNPCN